MVAPEHVSDGKAIQRRTGRTFHVATRFLPERTRHPTYVLYAFFRVADEVVDDPNPGPESERRSTLSLLRRGALGDESARRALAAREEGTVGVDAASIVAAFDALRRREGIDDAEVNAFVDAMERDVAATDYADHEELSGYLRGSSVAVANMMLSVMDPDDVAAARPHARAMAEAFQLTNFLRDVREDVLDYDRVYLPESSLATAGVTTADVRALEPTTPLRATICRELRRTETLYREGVAGIRTLPRGCQLAVLLAAVLYAEHHRLIRERNFDVFTAGPSLSLRRRLSLAARTWLLWRASGDPETVFYRVSTIDRAGERASGEPATNEPGTHSRLWAQARRATGRPLATLSTVVPWRGD